MRTKSSKFLSPVITLVVIGVVAGAWLQRQAIYDWYSLRGYEPSAVVSGLADNTTMSDATRRVFYVNHPNLEPNDTFNSFCRDNEQTIVLGCYIGGQRGIHIYDITDERLQGIEEVTAAHELLHAMYERLSDAERTKIDALTKNYYETVLADQRIKDNIAAYREKDAAIVPNELHSILGTEVRTLNPELEAYYAKYFTSRAKIVDYSEQYESLFSELKQKIIDYDNKLDNLKNDINTLEESLKSERDALKSENERLEDLAANKDYEAYNAAVPGFNRRLGAYNAAVSRYQGLIDDYNTTVEARNTAAIERSDLVKSINSKYQKL